MFGEFVKEKRVAKDLSLRKFCQSIEVDASNWSKVERGLLTPPQDEGKLKLIAEVLKIEFNSDEWLKLKDMSRIDAGIIPEDIISNKNLLDSLPAFFRTVRSDKPTPEELDKLIAMISRRD